MAIQRDDPYGAFNFKITIAPKSGTPISGSFAEISGMNTEITYADYRDGTDAFNRNRKIPLTYKGGDITLKRGLIGSLDLWNWVEEVRKGNMDAEATATIELMSEDNNQPVASWELVGVRPNKWTGPTLTAKDGSDVAMEELGLVCEDVKYI